MRVTILTEGGRNIGFGHIMRCLSLYQAFEEQGITPRLIINGDNFTEGLLRDKKYENLNWLRKKRTLPGLLKDADTVIVDSYLADIDLYKIISEKVEVPVYIDDIKRLKYPRGFIVNGNICAENLGYPKSSYNKYLLGTRYMSLRKEFWGTPERGENKKVNSIMLTFGGSDVNGITSMVLGFLKDKYSTLRKNVVISRGFRNIDKIERLKDSSINFVYKPDTISMRCVMLESDIAISAGGVTLCELIKVGIPTIGICAADNQEKGLKAWQKAGVIQYAGWYDGKDLLSNIAGGIKNIMPLSKRLKCSRMGKRFVDGKGGARLVERIRKGL